jgi:hypothetical protein
MFNSKLKQKVSDLSEMWIKINFENEKLKSENFKLKKQYSNMMFVMSNTPKFNVSDKVKEGLILERRIKDNSFPKVLLNPVFTSYLMIELAKAALQYYKNIKLGDKVESENNLKKMAEIMADKYWEYRVFNETSKTEKWFAEGSLNAL